MNAKPIRELTEKEKKSFWAKVDIRGPDECWNWKASLVGPLGYGQFRVRPRTVRSNRIVALLTFGEAPVEMDVLHNCDNPKCCNPKHLFFGTHQDNMDDKASKGRQPAGDQHWTHRTPELLKKGWETRRRNTALTQ